MPDGFAEAPPAHKFVPVCAIGASAGGVVALQNLFRQVPDDLGLAYVVILHLNPEEPSALSEILALCTKMPVHQVNDGPPLKPNCVYVIPPDRELVIDGDNVTARPFSEPRGQRALIDKFFRSVAAGRGDGVAIILSGAGSDGALGVGAMKEAGGIIMVQEPAEAGFPSMPQAAIATGMADFVAPIAQLAKRLAEVARSKEAVRSLDMDGAANDLRRIVAMLRLRIGHDFSSYKRATVLRRVQRRMQVCRKLTLADYADYLLTTPEEAQNLFSDLLISVTMFFRDEAAFEALARQAVRPMIEMVLAEGEDGIRIWVVGCATGEEAYSVAMLMHEQMAQQKVTVPFQIFATDLDDGALATAREGRYPRTIEADVTEDRLARFFVDEGAHYQVRKELREAVIFAKHSILREPPFMRLDLVTCRNLLIYLERTVQAQICSTFHYCLRPGRYLFLGSAETTDAAADLFAPVDRQARLYASRLNVGQSLPILPQHVGADQIAAPGRPVQMGTERAAMPAALHIEALETTAPPSALVDDAQMILHLSPSAGRFILNPAGPVSKELPAIVRPELRMDLRLALTRALDHNEATITLPTIVAFDQDRRRVAMQVVPVADAAKTTARALVYFLDGGEVAGRTEDEGLLGANADDVRRLYAELKSSQEALLISRSGHDVSIQELRAANEELQSINEEYRSTAEELETSKEELQSINEELHTVNAELKSKLESISAAHSDLQNLTAATEIGTLFLDPDLRIRMFTPPVAKLFNITRRDVGRFITDFTHHLDHDGLGDDARRVSEDLTPIEREVATDVGKRFSMRLRPYRTVDNRIDGTVVTFIDVSERAEAEAAQRKSEVRLRDVLNSTVEGFTHFAPDFTILDLNAEALRLDRRKREDLVGRSHWEAFPGTENSPLGDFYRGVMATRLPSTFEHRYAWPDGRTWWLEVRAYPTADGGMAIFWTDVSERKRRELNSAFLDEMTKALALQSTADEIMETAAERIGAYFHVSGCVFADVAEAENSVSVKYGWAADGAPSLVKQTFRFDEYVTDELRRTAYAGQVFAVNDTENDPRTNAESYAALKIGAIVAVHFLWGGFWTNYMVVTDTEARVWRADELALLTELTSRIFLRYERARAEAALRESDEQNQALFTVSPTPFLVLAPDAPRFTITAVNDAYLAATMTTRDALVGAGLFDMFTENPDRPGKPGAALLAQSLDRVLTNLRPDTMARIRYDIALPGGGFAARWWDPVNAPVLDEAGAIRAIIHHVTPATEVHLAELAERGQQERQAFLLELSDTLRPMFDPEKIQAEACRILGEHLGADRAYYAEIDEDAGFSEIRQNYLRASSPSLAGQHSVSGFGWILPALRRGETVVMPNVSTSPLIPAPEKAAMASIQVAAHVCAPLVKDGRLVGSLCITDPDPRAWTDAEADLVRETGDRIWAAVDRARAETALRDSEYRYRSALRVGRIGSWETNYASGVRRWSPEGMTLFGIDLPDGEGRVGGPDDEWRAALHPEECDFPETLTAEIARLDQREVEYRILRADGAVCWMHGYIQVLERDAQGGVTRSLNVAADITARREAEVKVRESEERQAFMLRFSDALRQEPDADSIADRALGMLQDELRLDRCYVGVYRLAEDWGEFPYQVGNDRVPPMPPGVRLSDFPDALRVASDRTLVIDDVMGVEGLSDMDRRNLSGLGLKAIVAASLRHGASNPLWSMVSVSAEPRRWTPGEVGMLEEATERTWAAIERARAEAALRDSEERFRSLAEAIEDVFYLIDLERNTLVYLSPRYEDIWGWPAATILDDLGTFGDTIHPEDRAITENAKAGQARGEPVMVEYRVVRPDGGIRWILDRSFPVPGAAGRRLAGVASDISDRRRAEDRVRAGDLRLRLLMESIRDYAIFTVDLDGNVTSWPAGAEAAFGWSEAEMLGRPAETTYTPEDVADRVPRTEMDVAMREGLAMNVRWHQRSDGSRVFINGSMQPLVGPDGKVQEFIKIGRDETETRRVHQALADSESRLRTLAEGIPQLVWRSMDDGHWTWSSPQWQAFTGQTIEQSLGRGWLDAVHPDDREAEAAAWIAARPTGMLDIEYRVRRASDGVWLWHHTRSLPVRDSASRIVEWLGTTTDVQEMKRLQERQSVMVAELQHRTRNLIAVVGAIARQTMMHSGPTGAFAEEFEHRLAALARVQGLLSRSEDEPVTIMTLIKMELNALGVSGDAELRVTLNGPPIPLRNAIVQTLALVLHELATNALKHGALSQEEGRLRVTWKVEKAKGKGHNLALEWTESGTAGEVRALPERRGYGRELIERALPYALGARTNYAFTPDGLHCTIDIPLDKRPSQDRRTT